MHMVRHQMALDNLTLHLPGQRVEDRTQVAARLPENGLSAPFGHKNYVVLAVPFAEHAKQAERDYRRPDRTPAALSGLSL
jgi:hypothetical protein